MAGVAGHSDTDRRQGMSMDGAVVESNGEAERARAMEEAGRQEVLRRVIESRVNEKWMTRAGRFGLGRDTMVSSTCRMDAKAGTLTIDLLDRITSYRIIGALVAFRGEVEVKFGECRFPMAACEMKSFILDCHKTAFDLMGKAQAGLLPVGETGV